MDDPATSPSDRLTVSHCCETSRLERQLLARVYQLIFPEVRRSLADPAVQAIGDDPRLAALQRPPARRQENGHVAM